MKLRVLFVAALALSMLLALAGRPRSQDKKSSPVALTPSADQVLVVRVARDAGGALALFANEQPVGPLAALAQAGGEIALTGATARLSAGGLALELTAREREVWLSLAEFPGWSARIPGGLKLAIRLDAQHTVIDLFTPEGQGGEVDLQFGDGAKALMGGGSRARFDFFRNQSYAFSGAGRVTATSADGEAFKLGADTLPMAGGPLITASTGRGLPHMQRVEPTTFARLIDQAGATLRVLMGGHELALDLATERIVSLANGTRVSFQRDAAGGIDWRVEKGDVRFELTGFEGTTVAALTGQSGVVRWASDGRQISLRNTTSEASLLISRAAGQWAPLPAGQSVNFNTPALSDAPAVSAVELFQAPIDGSRIPQAPLSVFK
jgi:hypothetical protein